MSNDAELRVLQMELAAATDDETRRKLFLQHWDALWPNRHAHDGFTGQSSDDYGEELYRVTIRERGVCFSGNDAFGRPSLRIVLLLDYAAMSARRWSSMEAPGVAA